MHHLSEDTPPEKEPGWGATAPREARAGLRPRAGVLLSAEKGLRIMRRHPPWVRRAGEGASCPEGLLKPGVSGRERRGGRVVCVSSLHHCGRERHRRSDKSLGTREHRALGASGRPRGRPCGRPCGRRPGAPWNRRGPSALKPHARLSSRLSACQPPRPPAPGAQGHQHQAPEPRHRAAAVAQLPPEEDAFDSGSGQRGLGQAGRARLPSQPAPPTSCSAGCGAAGPRAIPGLPLCAPRGHNVLSFPAL